MKLLGTNDDCVLAGSGPIFKPYYKKPFSVSDDKKKAVFLFKDKPKYRFVTVPKTTKYETIIFIGEDDSSVIFDRNHVIKYDGIINVLCFDGVMN